MNAHYTYFLILALSLAGPLALSFDSKVAFYKKWKYLFPAMIIPALLYIGWDMWFTHQQIWSFNPDYISGIHIYNLPIEEVLFFFVVPYCCVFIYECIRAYFPNIRHTSTLQYVFYALGLALFVTGIVYADRAYTAYTFLLLSLLIGLSGLFPTFFRHLHLGYFLTAYLIILIPFLVVNGYLTAIPVVLYNNAENLQIRIYSIPFEDVFYGMLLILLNITGYERLQQRK